MKNYFLIYSSISTGRILLRPKQQVLHCLKIRKIFDQVQHLKLGKDDLVGKVHVLMKTHEAFQNNSELLANIYIFHNT